MSVTNKQVGVPDYDKQTGAAHRNNKKQQKGGVFQQTLTKQN